MTSQTKATELVNKYYNLFDLELDYLQSKQCALIAVDEILSELAYTQNYVEDNMNKIAIYISYWQNVKQEINNL